jgi:mRNA-degrading endonuclease RelE of RelBE toxin-antitoxin system
MSYTIAFHKGALKDYKEACKWYREKSIKTEINFKETLDLRLQDIAENPDAYGVRFKNVRAISLKKFPYLIFYEVEHTAKFVYVIAVWHEARSRDVLQERI